MNVKITLSVFSPVLYLLISSRQECQLSSCVKLWSGVTNFYVMIGSQIYWGYICLCDVGMNTRLSTGKHFCFSAPKFVDINWKRANKQIW